MGINWSIFHSEHICKNWPTPATCSPKMLWSHMAGRITTITNLSFSYIIQNLSKANYIERGARVVHWWEHLISSHHCGPGSNPGVNTACGLSLLLVLLQFSPTLKNHHLQILIQPGNQVDEEPLSRCATSKLLFIYILIYWKVSMFWRLFWLMISWTLTFMKLLGSRPVQMRALNSQEISQKSLWDSVGKPKPLFASILCSCSTDCGDFSCYFFYKHVPNDFKIL